MPRVVLTPEEREIRRKERSRLSFSDAAYKHRYDPAKEGFGSVDDWMKIAEQLFGGNRPLADGSYTKPGAPVSEDLKYLFLTEMPKDLAGLKHAYKQALMKKHHPDVGGSHEATIMAQRIFEKLAKEYK